VDFVPVRVERCAHKTQKLNEVAAYDEILQEGIRGSGVSDSIWNEKNEKIDVYAGH
jgi:hypothetical protein